MPTAPAPAPAPAHCSLPPTQVPLCCVRPLLRFVAFARNAEPTPPERTSSLVRVRSLRASRSRVALAAQAALQRATDPGGGVLASGGAHGDGGEPSTHRDALLDPAEREQAGAVCASV